MKHSRISHLLTAAYLSFAVANTSLVYADDTEIYLNASSAAGAANLLFSLDTSGSMSSLVDENNNGTIDSGERTRIEVLKEAMLTVLDSLPPLNAGIMRFHYYGGPILYPVADIDEFACVIEGNCTASTPTTGIVNTTSVITNGNDDAELEDGTTMVLDRVALDMGERPGGFCATFTGENVVAIEEDTAESDNPGTGFSNSSPDLEIPRDGSQQQVVGVRFQDVDIPKDATVTDARIVFTIDGTSGTGYNAPIDVTIVGENMAGTRVQFTSGNQPENRLVNPTSATVNWETGEFPSIGDTLTTENLAAILNEYVTDATWPATDGDDMVFVFFEDPGKDPSSTGSRELESVGTSAEPRLTYTYQVCGSPTASNMRTGLRFTDIDVPQGSTITGARIDFINTTAETGNNPTFSIKAENVDDAAPFALGSPFTSRTFTTGVTWDTASTPALGDWDPVDTTYSTPDLAAQVQAIVNRSGWCGGNDMMFMIERTGGDAAVRTAYSVEGDSQKAPVLTITYDADSNPTGCTRTTIVKVLSGTNNDAEEDTSNGSIDATSVDLEMVQDINDQVVGLRFTDIPIAKNTVITNAKITFTADEVDSGATSLTFKGQKSADAEIFSTNTNNLTNTTNRPRTTASVAWSPGAFTVDGELHETPDLSSIIQEIVNQSDWAAGNDVAIFVSGSGKRVAQSFDRNPAAAPRLTITFEGEATTTKKTVRERLKGIVEELTQASGTPLSGAMLEAAYYFRGEDVVFGRQRGYQSSGFRVSRVSHEASYIANGATVTYPGNCTADNLNHADCAGQVIAGGDPEYKSPITSECQSNYLVQLTDGGGYYTGDNLTGSTSVVSPGLSLDEQDRIEAMQAKDENGNSVTLGTCDTPTAISATETFSSGDSHDDCTVKLAKFLHENDQIFSNTQNLQSGTAPIDDVQSLDIYNIGFNLCGSGNVTAVDSTTGESICCSVANSSDNGDGTRSCSSPVTDPDSIKVLKAQSAVGGGQYFNANTVDELVAAFTTITNDIIEKDTSFVAPSIAANAFNRLFSRDEVFFGLFEPAQQPRWDGNVKKYNICVDPDPDGTPGNGDDCTLGDVLDANGTEAIVESPDPMNPLSDDGLFSTAAQSEWSDLVDGRTTKLGGAGGEIDDFTERLIYTDYYNGAFATTGQSLGATGFHIDSSNWDDAEALAVRDQVCADPTDVSAGSDCETRMLWMLGKNTFLDPNPPAVSAGTRWWFHDVLHSSPVAVTYGQDASQNFIDKVLVGTNDGGLHFINGTTGEEEWVFMPRAVLSAQPSLYDNTTTNHIYGMDSTPILYVTDVNQDGTIDPSAGDSVKVVVTQRRGGDNIYALDLTPASTLTSTTALDGVVPKFLWSISAATTGFSALGQTWSEPALVTIDTISGPVAAFVFGGGYDSNLDEDDGSGIAKKYGAEAGAPNSGNAIYVVNAATGDLIFSVNGDSSTTAGNIYVPEMQYAIPSNVTVFDSDGDGYEDRLYVGDTVGQIFRVDLINVDPAANDDTKGKGDSVVGILARVGTPGTLAQERRFFYKPSVVQVIDTEYSDAAGGEYDYVLIGTGNRANPLDTEVEDRFYGFRDVNTGPMTDSNSNNIADNYPLNIDASANGGPIVDNGANPELIDVSTAVLDPTADSTIPDALGWYFDFGTATSGRVGEKVLAGSGVFQNILIFTTYVPDDVSLIQDPCKAAEGTGFAYNFNILSTAASLDWDADDPTNPSSSPDPVANRAAELGSGIPSEAVPIFTAEGVTVLVGTGGGAENLGKVADLPRFNTYWYEEY